MIVTREDGAFETHVRVVLPLADFREHVEWLEEMAPEDECTHDMRGWLNEIDPPARSALTVEQRP